MKINTETIDPTPVGQTIKINFDHPDTVKGERKIMSLRQRYYK